MSNSVQEQSFWGKQAENLKTTFSVLGSKGTLKNIGKPVKFSNLVDPQKRISEYIKQKMNIIDLVPCDFTIDFAKLASNFSSDSPSKKNLLEDLRPTITFDQAMKKYSDMCGYYGLTEYQGLRLFTTDETTATDEFRNGFNENIIAQGVNTLTKFGRSFRAFGSSVTSGFNEGVEKSAEVMTDQARKAMTMVGFGQSTTETAASMINLAQDVLISGKTVSMPKVWDKSSYQPNMSVVIKLVSPYGSVKAIHEFIIKPLTYLILLSLPRTNDGIAFGYPPVVNVNAYGIVRLPVAAISGLTLRRGGNDTSFNIYKQPLSIDISLEITNLVDGCAAFDKLNQYEKGSLSFAENVVNDLNIYDKMDTTLIQTPGKIIRSLAPSGLTTLNADNLGLTGNFDNPPKNLAVKEKKHDFLATNQQCVEQTELEQILTNQSNIILTQSFAADAQVTGTESSKKIVLADSTDSQQDIINDTMLG